MPGPMQLNHEHTESYGSGGGGGTPDPHTHTESDIVDLGSYAESLTELSDVYSSMSPTDGQVLTYDTTNGWQAETPSGGGGSGGLYDALVILKDVKAAGTSGGAAVADTWTARVLNTEEVDTASICTLSSNQFTLPAGSYYIEGISGYHKTRSYKTRIRNITDSSTAVVGSVGISDDNVSVLAHSFIKGYFTIAATKTFELQYRADQNEGGSTSVLGNAFATDSTEDNVFSQLVIHRLA